MRDIVILGGGFAGAHIASALETHLSSRRKLRLTLVNDRSHFVFTPLLPQVAAGDIRLSSICIPLRDYLSPATRLVIDTVGSIDLDKRILRGDKGDIPFDYLVVCPGAQVDWGNHPEWAAHARSCKTGRDAVAIGDRIDAAAQQAFRSTDAESRRELLTFLVAGGGPTGVQLAADLTSMIRRRYRPHWTAEEAKNLRLIIVERAPTLVPEFPKQMQQIAASHLERNGVEIRLGCHVVDRNDDTVHLSTGEEVRTESFFWCGGVTTADVIRRSNFSLDDLGRARVHPTLESIDALGVYVLGDAAAHPALDSTTRTARTAVHQAERAALNLLADLSGRTKEPWVPQRSGTMMTLGRDNAIVEVRSYLFQGRAARALHQGAWAALIPTPLKKLAILRDWLQSDEPVVAQEPRQLTDG
jgi:NADH:ubiquinone reductase (H+-translocating)